MRGLSGTALLRTGEDGAEMNDVSGRVTDIKRTRCGDADSGNTIRYLDESEIDAQSA